MYLFLIALLFFGGVQLSTGSLRLRSQALNELSCPAEPIPLFQGRVNYAWLGLPSKWYIPMGSERVYRLSAEILLGRPARSYAELDLIDLSVSSFGSFYKISGFGGTKSFRKGCAHISRSLTTFPRNLLETRCFALWGTRGSDVTPARSAVDSIVWTDNENAVLIVPCNHESNTLDWFVLTKRTTFSDEVKENVLSHITKLGFNPQNAVYYDYENKRIIRKISSPPVQNYQWPTFNEFKAPTHKIHQPIQSSYSSPTVNEIKAPIPSHTIHPPLLSSYTPYYTVPSSYYTF